MKSRTTHEILIENTVQCHAVNQKTIEKMVKWIFKQHHESDWTMSIIFVDDTYISDLHERYLDVREPTDVLSFDLTDSDGPREGEIYISCDTAYQNALRYHVSLENELCRLIAHGLYHILGFNDETPQQKRAMRNLENAALSSIY